ncbi:MAG: hypothetical protein A7315_02680 [Candidatus Altiarchaeales archaeon WOR_SM1_79]|nr:MAG: hypothetical protein A7315_02680 [Candidatus Altiarchaeales archaeon WOR_SM1_79]
MALATDYSGTHNLYEKYGGRFAAGNLVNVGSCVANSHITGAAIKVANIFAKRKLRANYEEIADYCLNRIGAVGLVLGTMSQKAVSIGFGCMRLGVPVIWGPQGIKYRMIFLIMIRKIHWIGGRSMIPFQEKDLMLVLSPNI